MSNFPIPVAWMDDRFAFVGTAGSGKTYTSSAAVEHLLLSSSRVVIIDPLGVWWGLRAKADGKRQAFKIAIFGGAHGDLPLTEGAGAIIGETAADMQESCIIDLSTLGTKASERRFMLAFLTALYRKTNGSPVHLVMDEADMFAPQKLLDKEGDAAKLLSMMETIVRRGRVKGFIPWLITQRPAVISKDVLSQADGLISFKLTSSQDRAAIGGWIEGQADQQQGKAILASLPTLARGEGIVWIPGRNTLDRVQFPKKLTFDSSRSPKRGEAKTATQLQPLDLGALRDKLAKVENEVKASDPRALRAEIMKLQQQIKKVPSDPNAEQRGWQAGYVAGHDDGFKSAIEAHIEQFTRLSAKHAEDVMAAFRRITPLKSPPAQKQKIEGKKLAAQPIQQPRMNLAIAHPSGELNVPQGKVLQSLAFWLSIGNDKPTRDQVAAVSGYKPGSGNFNNIIGSLTKLSQVAIPEPGRVCSLVSYEPMTAEEAKERFWKTLNGPQQKVITAAISTNDALSREELAQESSYAAGSGNFNNIVGKLTAIDALRIPRTGMIELSPWVRELMSA